MARPFSDLLDRFKIQTDQLTADFQGAAIITEDPELTDPLPARKAGLLKIALHEFPCESDLMKIKRVLLPAEYHIHDMKALFTVQGRIHKQLTQDFEVWDADA